MADLLIVQLPAEPDRAVERAFGILKDRIETRCSVTVQAGAAGASLSLDIDPALPTEAFRIADRAGTVCVAGGSGPGLLYGIGKFLRTSGYAGGFTASPWRGTSAPQGSLRGMYLATHFHNYFHKASESEIIRYVEDLALWGVNAIQSCFPGINLNGPDDPAGPAAFEMLRRYSRAARGLGLQFGTGLNNTLYKGIPDSIRAARLEDPLGRRGNSGYPVCPSIPEGHEAIMACARRVYEELAPAGLDILVTWPYDEGGCSCERCSPWGCNGFLQLTRDLAELGRQYFPGLKVVMSTWTFDTPPEGEWEGLSAAVARDPGGIDYIQADAHEDYPRYPLDVGVPGGLPLVNFPEISMWGNWPWGGVGAHPIPARCQELWDQVKHAVVGGFPYCEGIYEDMNKAVQAGFYWDRDRSAMETIREYAAFEYGEAAVDDTVRIVEALEAAAGAAFANEPVDTERVLRTAELAEDLNCRLPAWARASWRWEILYLRALLDRERFAGPGLQSDAAQQAMMRLVEIFHCEVETDDPYQHRVRPDLKGTVDRNGRL